MNLRTLSTMVTTLGVLLLLTSAHYATPADSRTGYQAPSLTLDGDNDWSPLRQHRGATIVLTFWSSADAPSRLVNRHYDRLSRSAAAAFTHISVNLDRSAAVFRSVVAVDELNRSTHHHAAGIDHQRALLKAWRLDDGYHAFLIDGQGNIVAIDPTDAQLLALNH